MKISIAIEKFDPQTGGAERYCWDFAHYLAQKGHNINILCMRASEPNHESINITQLNAIRFPQVLRHLSFAMFHYFKARKMKEYIHFCVGNTFYMDIYQPHGGVHSAWFQKETLRFPIPIRSYVRFLKRLSLKDIVQRVLEWWVYNITKPRVIAISDMVAQDIRSIFNYLPSKIQVIPNGIDIQKFSSRNRSYREEIRKRYGLNKDDFVFIFVAQNFTLKGFDILIKACHILDDVPFNVLVIGPESASAKKKVQSLKSKIVFGGRANDLENIYPACDCLVHPTYYDACSLVVLEALASHIPVITTDANGASMFISEENGFVIPSGSVDSLASAMRNMVLNNKARQDISVTFQDHKNVFEQLEKVMAGCHES